MRSSILMLFLVFNISHAYCQTGNLDGKSYKIEVKQETGKNHKPKSGWPTDTLKFDAGKMFSHYMQKRERFYPSSYSSKSRKTELTSVINFKYENFNLGRSLLSIEGIVTGTSISGNIRWTSSNKSRTQTYSFQGKQI